jgi:aryl sulfotransferase
MPALLRPALRQHISPVCDSRRWDAFEPRDGDIVIATHSKCGTTWTQRIVDLLVHQSPDIRPVGDISPWLDATIFESLDEMTARLKAQTHRRYIKSHLTLEELPLWDSVKYIHVGRDGRDARLSWQNHQQGATPELVGRIIANAMAMAAEGGAPAMPPPSPHAEPRDFVLQWLDQMEAELETPGPHDGNYFDFEMACWGERRRPNLLFVHYDDMKRDLAGEMRRISESMEIPTPESLMPSLVEAARFDNMKKDGDALLPNIQKAFDRGADRFLNKGETGR